MPKQLTMFDDAGPKPRGEPGPPCLRCGADTVVSPGRGPHHSRADCPSCKAWRWLPKPRALVDRAPRAGFDDVPGSMEMKEPPDCQSDGSDGPRCGAGDEAGRSTLPTKGYFRD